MIHRIPRGSMGLCILGGLIIMAASTTQAAMEESIALTQGWVERAFAAAPAEDAISFVNILHDDEAGTTKLNRAAAGGPIRLGDKTYERGFGVNSNCTLGLHLASPGARLVGRIGVDRNVDNSVASLRFHVLTGAKEELFATDVLKPDGKDYPLDVDLMGGREFLLMVSDGGDGRGWDQGDWADVKVILADGTELWLDELALKSCTPAALPFSFTYGGKPSAELLPAWTSSVSDEKADANRLVRTLVFTDPETGLELRAVATVYMDTPGVDWTLYFTNKGANDLPVLENLNALDLSTYPGVAGASPVLHRLAGSVAGQGDWLPSDTAIPVGKTVAFEPIAGRSSAGASPFFHLDWQGGGVLAAIGWTGQWKAEAGNTDGRLRLTAGLKKLRLSLKPGETIRSPRVLLVFHEGNDKFEPYNLFRRTMMAHIMPRVAGELVVPPIAHLSTAFYEFDKGTEKDVLSHLDSLKGLGFEYFWLDAYYGKDVFPAIGNYVLPLEQSIDVVRFPRGIKPIGDATRAAGMKFLLWMEPERITPGTLMATEHPEWVVMPPNNGWGMIDLGRPAARDYVTKFIQTAITEYGIDCLRIDNAVDFASLWGILDSQTSPDRVGMAEIRYVEGLYKMWDDLLTANPHLFIDNCASGGQRIDLETCSRSIPLWRTDGTIEPLFRKEFNEAGMRNQVMTGGLSRFLPLHVSGQMGADPYNFRSGFNGGISFAEDVRPADYPREQLRAAIAEGKTIRKYFLGDFYPLTDVNTREDTWSIIQYDRPEQGDGMIMAFRRPESLFSAFTLMTLRGIDPAAGYEVTERHTYEPGPARVLSGADLLKLSVAVNDCPGSVIVEYKRVK